VIASHPEADMLPQKVIRYFWERYFLGQKGWWE
jgi:hypothetical protein